MAIQIRRGTNTEWESNNSNIVVGEPAIATDAERFFVGTASGDYAEFANLDIIAPAYDTTTSYVVGDIINYHGKLYSCNTPCSGAFNLGYWDEKSLAEILKDLENEITYSQYEIGYADGELITIDNGASEIPVKDLTLDIDAVQDLHGYDHPWVGGAGKNKLDDTALLRGFFNPDGTFGSNNAYISYEIASLPAGTYTFSTDLANAYIIRYLVDNVNHAMAMPSQSFSFTLSASANFKMTIRNTSTSDISSVTPKSMVESGSSATTYEPYENICPISGWTGVNVTRAGKNLLNNVNPTILNAYFASATISANDNQRIVVLQCTPNTAYTFSWNRVGISGSQTARIVVFTSEPTYGSSGNVVAASVAENGTATFTTGANDTFLAIHMGDVRTTDFSASLTASMLELGSTATSYEPYNGNTYSITWQTEAGTVYGGTLDVTTGVLTITHEYVDLGSLTWSLYYGTVYANVSGAKLPQSGAIANIICSQYKASNITSVLAKSENGIIAINEGQSRVNLYDASLSDKTAGEVKTAMNGVQLVYELATPQVVQLTPTQVRTLLGTNNLWNQMNSNNELAYRISNALN